MKNKYNIIVTIIAVVVIVLLGIKIFSHNTIGASAVGTTDSNQRIAQIICNNTATTTYASMYNSDTNDRLVENVKFYFTASTTSPFANLEVGTSSGIVGASQTMIAQTALATSTLPIYADASQISGVVGSSTQPVFVSNIGRTWNAGSYLNFTANATSTGYCFVSVIYAAE